MAEYCPNCKAGAKAWMEKSPTGNSKCLLCAYVGPHSDWIQKDPPTRSMLDLLFRVRRENVSPEAEAKSGSNQKFAFDEEKTKKAAKACTEWHACVSGDCEHEKYSECFDTVFVEGARWLASDDQEYPYHDQSPKNLEAYPCPKTLNDKAFDRFPHSDQIGHRFLWKDGYRAGHGDAQIKTDDWSTESYLIQLKLREQMQNLVKSVAEAAQYAHKHGDREMHGLLVKALATTQTLFQGISDRERDAINLLGEFSIAAKAHDDTSLVRSMKSGISQFVALHGPIEGVEVGEPIRPSTDHENKGDVNGN